MGCCVGEFGQNPHAVAFSSMCSYYSSSCGLRALKHRNSLLLLSLQKLFLARKYAQANFRPVRANTDLTRAAAFSARWLDARVEAAIGFFGNDNVFPLFSSLFPPSPSGVGACSVLSSSSFRSVSRDFTAVAALKPLSSVCSSTAAPAPSRVASALWDAFSSPVDAIQTVEKRNALVGFGENRFLPAGLRRKKREYDGGERDWSQDASTLSPRAGFLKKKQEAAYPPAVGCAEASVGRSIGINVDRSNGTGKNSDDDQSCYSVNDSAEGGGFWQRFGGRSGCADSLTLFAGSNRIFVFSCRSVNRRSSTGTTRRMVTTPSFRKTLNRLTLTSGHSYKAPTEHSQLQTLSPCFQWRTKESSFPPSVITTPGAASPSSSHCIRFPRRMSCRGAFSVTRPRPLEDARQSSSRTSSRHRVYVCTTRQHHECRETPQTMRSEEREMPSPAQGLQLQELVIAAYSLCGRQHLQMSNFQSEQQRKGFLQERGHAPGLCNLPRSGRVNIERTCWMYHRTTPRYYYMTRLRHSHGWAAVQCTVKTEKARQLPRKWLSTTTAAVEENIHLAPLKRNFCSFCKSQVRITCRLQALQCRCRRENNCQVRARTFWWGRSAGETEVSGAKVQMPQGHQGEPATATAVTSSGAPAGEQMQDDQNVEEQQKRKDDGVPQAALQTAPLKMTFVSADGETVLECTYRVDVVYQHPGRIHDPGQTVLMVAFENDVGIEGVCGGQCACSTCHVIVEEKYFRKFPPPDDEEQDLLDTTVHTTNTSRLACQLKLSKEHNGETTGCLAEEHVYEPSGPFTIRNNKSNVPLRLPTNIEPGHPDTSSSLMPTQRPLFSVVDCVPIRLDIPPLRSHAAGMCLSIRQFPLEGEACCLLLVCKYLLEAFTVMPMAES